jgi:hypothetical protein
VEQHDAYGVVQQGAITSEDISDLAVKLLAKDIYIERLQRRVLELTPAPEPLENGAGAVAEAAEIVKGKAKA